MSEWYRPAGSTATDGWDTRIGDHLPGWQHTALWVGDLRAGESRTLETGGWETLVLPLAGGAFVVEVEGRGQELLGRADVWDGPSDLVYVPRGTRFTVTSVAGGRVALPAARAETAYDVTYLPAQAVPVELRGTGSCSREVRNFGTPGVLAADSLIACEVLTPAGNWSSYPPHKHDEDRPGIESELEEIYYFRLRTVAGGPPEGDPVGYQRVYGTDERPIDVLAEVRTGDVVLVPHGWHGPSMAAPGYDMYYLNVMAGPGPERAWLICDDPTHTWVRSTWPDQPVDPRVPFHG